MRVGGLIELLESDHWGDFSECSAGHVESVFADESRSAASDPALAESFSFGVFALVREPDVFVSHVAKSKNMAKRAC